MSGDGPSRVTEADKQLVWDYWRAIEAPDHADRATAAAAALTPDGQWHGHAPVGSGTGSAFFIDEVWEPLLRSFPDLRRETFIFFGGTSNGRIDGDIGRDGHRWVTGTGVLRGTFAADYLTIPSTGREVAMRWGEFCRIADGRIDETFFLIDVVDLMRQADIAVLPPSRGVDGVYPPPATGDGVLLGDRSERNDKESAHSLDHIRRFIFDGLNAYDQNDLVSMGMADFFHPDVQWYGPGGIGACLSLTEFEDNHQRPWLVAFPDRQVQDLDGLIAEGPYSGAPGWGGVLATHGGPYLDVEPTGNTIEFNGLDWWRRDGDRYVENWVSVDMVHLFDQFGVDLIARMHAGRQA